MRRLLGLARVKMLVLATTGGVVFQTASVPFQGCDEAVRVALIDGLNGAAHTLANTLIVALFISIAETDNSSDSAATTV